MRTRRDEELYFSDEVHFIEEIGTHSEKMKNKLSRGITLKELKLTLLKGYYAGCLKKENWHHNIGREKTLALIEKEIKKWENI